MMLLLGEDAADKGINKVLACGAFAAQVIDGFSGAGFAFATRQELLDYLAENPLMAGTAPKEES